VQDEEKSKKGLGEIYEVKISSALSLLKCWI
jgi:hypothetical protein